MQRTQPHLILPLLVLLSLCAFSTTSADVYFHEGFNGTGLPPGWQQIRLVGMQAAWSVVAMGSNPSIPPYAGAGQAKFNSFDAAVGEQARLISPRINLASATDPFLIFFMYHDDEYLTSYDSLYVEATTGDSIAGPWTTLLGVQRPRPFNAWRKEFVSLYPYRGMSRVFLSLRGVSRYGNNIFVDEFRVADSSFHDLGVVALFASAIPSSPAVTGEPAVETASRYTATAKRGVSENPLLTIVGDRSAPNSALTLNAIVRNFGTFNEPVYSVSWSVDNVQQPSFAGGPIEPRIGLDTTTLVWMNPTAGTHTFMAWSVLPSDSNRSNDTTRISAYVLEPGTFFYELFNGSTFPPSGWITINRDGGTLPAWFRGADTSAFPPFEGSGFAANNFQRANGSYLDDYLISPPISNVGQPGWVDSLVFLARSQLNLPPASNFPDSLMVLLSTGGTDTSSFTILLDYFAVPKGSWARKAYSLVGLVPQNSTIRVAFRYLLYNVQPTSGSGDFVGIDAMRVIRTAPASVPSSPIPSTFVLQQNYPNPFNSSTRIRFSIRGSGLDGSGTRAESSRRVTLKVFNVLGQEVATLIDGILDGGGAERHGAGGQLMSVVFDGSTLPSGVYLYQLRAEGVAYTKKMVLIR